MGRSDYPEVLPEMAGGSLAPGPCSQSSIRVTHLPGLAEDSLHTKGDEFLAEKTLP